MGKLLQVFEPYSFVSLSSISNDSLTLSCHPLPRQSAHLCCVCSWIASKSKCLINPVSVQVTVGNTESVLILSVPELESSGLDKLRIECVLKRKKKSLYGWRNISAGKDTFYQANDLKLIFGTHLVEGNNPSKLFSEPASVEPYSPSILE